MVVLEVFPDAPAGPTCRDCGDATQIIGAETHSVIRQLTIVTFQCVGCQLLGATVALTPPEPHGGDDAG
jgi:hypothetical protein